MLAVSESGGWLVLGFAIVAFSLTGVAIAVGFGCALARVRDWRGKLFLVMDDGEKRSILHRNPEEKSEWSWRLESDERVQGFLITGLNFLTPCKVRVEAPLKSQPWIIDGIWHYNELPIRTERTEEGMMVIFPKPLDYERILGFRITLHTFSEGYHSHLAYRLQPGEAALLADHQHLSSV
jgi:hypothetical protein